MAKCRKIEQFTRSSCPRWLRAAVFGFVLGLSLAVGAEAARVMLGRNLHEVVPGKVYRCGQLSGAALAQVIRAYHIRTVVNLRGCCDPLPWYFEECRTTHGLHVQQQDIALSAGRLPSGDEIRRLLEVVDRTDYPILIHCKRGADRTGLVSALILLLQTDVGFAEARRQLGLRYGHLRVGRPAYLDEFLDFYASWLQQEGRAHCPENLRQWIQHGYCPGECRATIELLDKPPFLRRAVPVALHVRVWNTSMRSWRLRPGTNAGIHAGYVLWDDEGNCLVYERAGLFDALVAPGQSLDLTLALPGLDKPGRYRLRVDMIDEPHCWFHQTGSEPLETDLEVR
jgi:hypothetical protein